MKPISTTLMLRFSNPLAFRAITLTFLVLLLMSLQGCEQIRYYGQAIQGHLAIMSAEKDINELLDDPNTDPVLRQRLKEVVSARTFAEDTLKITQANTNYTNYVQLDRKYPVWSVTAAPDVSLTPRQWCYPFVGCASYRGYYSEQEAKDYAQGIQNEGKMDVYVGGADAYSTLGWFNDPVLSTFFRRDKTNLHALIFHELAHQVLYLQGDSTFNESFASAVEEIGVELWLKEQPELIKAFQQRKQRADDFTKLLLSTQTQLKHLYASGETYQNKLSKKSAIIDQLLKEYDTMKANQWQGYQGYDHWFKKPINNARLALISTYSQWVPAFKTWIKQCDYNFPVFYQAVEQLSQQTPEERKRVLTNYAKATSYKVDDSSLPCKYLPNN